MNRKSKNQTPDISYFRLSLMEFLKESAFIFEFTHVLLKRSGDENEKNEKESRKDEIMREIIKLIAQNFKEQHEVAFYADKLNMTAGNLLRTITVASGKSPIPAFY